MGKVLPYVPSPLEQLTPYINQAQQSIMQGLQRRQGNQDLARLLQPKQAQGQEGEGQAPSAIHAGSNMQQAEENAVLKATAIADARTRATGDPNQGKIAADAYLQDYKLRQKEAQQIRQEERALGMAGSKDYFEKVESDRLKIPEEKLATEMIMDSILSGEIDPWSSAHIGEIARSFGAPESLTKILETPGSKEFKTARKTFIGNTIKDAFKGTTTKIEINLAEDMLSELGVSEDANLASAWGLQSALEIREQRIRLTDQLREQGVSPSKIPATVDKMLQPFRKELHDEYFEAIRSLRKENK